MSVQVLIVDDSPVVRQIIRFHLGLYRCRVVGEASSARAAYEFFGQDNPNLVTLDLMMPNADGMDTDELFKKIKKEAPRTVVVVVSAVPFEGTRAKFQNGGALAYIVKPFNQFSFEPARRKLARVFSEFGTAANI